jgi:hypothetical protein
MKGLALSCVLFCGLALVLVYAATQGVGMRTPTFIPTVHGATADRRTQVIEGQPIVNIERGDPTGIQPTSIPKPEVTVTRVSRKRKHASTKVVTKVPQPVDTQPKPAPTRPQPSIEKPKPKIEDKPEPVQTAPEPPAKEEPVVHPRDVSDSGPLTDSDVEWRRQTLERWRREAEDHRDGASRSTVSTTKPGQEPELKGTPAEGLFPAHDEKKPDKKKKKKRHRFLFFRW